MQSTDLINSNLESLLSIMTPDSDKISEENCNAIYRYTLTSEYNPLSNLLEIKIKDQVN